MACSICEKKRRASLGGVGSAFVFPSGKIKVAAKDKTVEFGRPKVHINFLKRERSETS